MFTQTTHKVAAGFTKIHTAQKRMYLHVIEVLVAKEACQLVALLHNHQKFLCAWQLINGGRSPDGTSSGFKPYNQGDF